MKRSLVGGMVAALTFASGDALAQKALPTVDQQIMAAVMALPADMRAGATVMGYKTAGKLETLREGKNGMNCLALFAVEENFHIACYHNGMEPFMARGRELRAQGVKTTAEVDSVRFREVRSGTLKMPVQAAMYQLFGTKTTWEPETGKLTGTRSLLVVYIPGATAESTGLSPVPVQTGPWIMSPGTPKAHIMLQGTMTP